MSAAFELSRPEHGGRYHVTVYQQGWRLGGKGASGRGPADRIEEHGLHLWLGYYENAFGILRECYQELGRDPRRCRIAHWRDAFFPDGHVTLADRALDGSWLNWGAFFPPGAGAPGDPLTGRHPYTVQSYMVRAAELVVALLRSAAEQEGAEAGAPDRPSGTPEALVDAALRLLRLGQLAGLAALLEAGGLLRGVLERLPVAPADLALRLIDALAEAGRRQLESVTAADHSVRRLWQVIDLVLAGLRGSVRFNLATDPRGFDALNDYEMRDWLRINGASEQALESAFVRGLYDLGFAYRDGDTGKPTIAAGVGLRGAVRMFFTYRGAVFWKMRGGMGDIVFAPLYEVLARRGVSFRFFHRLEQLRLAPPERLAPGERPYVEAIELDVQAEVAGGGDYRPLVDVRGVPSWPARPDYSQLVDGERLENEGVAFESHWDRRRVGRRRLEVTRDFDFVVLAVGGGAVPHVAGELVERVPSWRRMAASMETVATQAFQLWMSEDMEQLGWPGPPTNLSGFVEPFDTWADMRQLIEEEGWPEEPGAIAYFCSVLATPEPAPPRSATGYESEMRRRVRRNAVRFLERHVATLWPRATGPDGFRWELLMNPDGGPHRSGSDRFDSQFWTANVNPTDRYVLSPPGALADRLSPLDISVDNLTVAGDWTDCGHNMGCVESAVISGRLAAHALSQQPPLAEIIGYDHP